MIRKILSKIFKRVQKDDPQARPKSWPTREEIENLPPFEALELKDIVEVVTDQGAHRAHDEIMAAGVVGFDTESQPTFVKGHKSDGPHVAQFATLDRAYIFMLHHPESRKVVRKLIAAPALKKVGFGLSEDLRRIPIKLGIEPKSVVDLESVFKERGHGKGVGVKVAVAIVFKRRFMKSKKASTSNWKRHQLSPKQLLYAANDAYAPVKIYHAMHRR